MTAYAIGCHIDGSHHRTTDFIAQVIRYAHRLGYEIEIDQMETDLVALDEGTLDDDEMLDVLDSLEWCYEEAMNFLHDTAPDGYYWEVDDQSLFFREESDV